MNETTYLVISGALDAAMLQHRLAVHNVSNSHSEGFVPSRLDWQNVLRDLHRVNDGTLSAASVDLDRHVVQSMPGEVVAMEAQVSELLQNSLRYRTLVTAFNKLHAMTTLAITGRTT